MSYIADAIQAAEAADINDSNRLPVLAASLKANVARLAANRQDWVEIELAIGVELAEVRSRFPANDDIGFGKWLDANDVKIGKNDRAAYIAMGKDPARMRAVLAATDRTSIRYIFAHDWTLPHAGKGAQASPKSTFKQTTNTRVTIDKALDVIKRRAAAGESLSYDDIKKESGVSDGSVTAARAAYQAEQDALKGSAKIEDIILSGSAQDKLDAKLRAYKKELDLQFEARVKAEVDKRWEENSLPAYFKQLAWVEKLLSKPHGLMKRLQYRKLVMCVHPDNSASVEVRNEVFALVNSLEAKLVSNDTDAPDFQKVRDMPKKRDGFKRGAKA